MLRPLVLTGLLFLAFLACPRCAPPAVKRPMAGDRVTPELSLVGPWPAGGLAQVIVRLEARDKDDANPAFIQFDDVPYEVKPRATISFWKDDAEIDRLENLELERDC